jgi:hypothetical protein
MENKGSGGQSQYQSAQIKQDAGCVFGLEGHVANYS